MYIPPFQITTKMTSLISEISEQVGGILMRLGNHVPSPMLRKKNQIKTIHSSLAIENNTLSLKQVTDIVDGKRVLGAPDEIQEVKNAVEAYCLMQECRIKCRIKCRINSPRFLSQPGMSLRLFVTIRR